MANKSKTQLAQELVDIINPPQFVRESLHEHCMKQPARYLIARAKELSK